MFLHILQRDLKRKKTMNTILLLFIIIASMFMASSIPNIITVMNGMDYFFDKAGVGDYVVINQKESGIKEMEEFLNSSKAHKGYRSEELIFGTSKMMSKDGDILELSATSLIQCIEKMDCKLLTNEGDAVAPVKAGEFMLSRRVATDNNLKVGDKVEFDYCGVHLELTFVGWFKDAIFGTPMMGNARIILAESDYNKLLEKDIVKTQWIGHIYNVDTDDITQFKSELSSVNGIIFDGARSMLNMCYIMEMIVAAVVLIIGAILVVISFVVLKFMINFTITEEFREIGVMKAIGLKNGKIRSLYVVKYLAFAIVGSLIGLALSIPFGNVLLDIATTNMVLGNDAGFILNVLGAVLVIVITAGYAYACTGIIKKSSPIDAIRNGQTGERYKQKKGYRIGKSHLSPSGYMALNDIKSAPKRYITIIIAFALCCLLTLIIGNTSATMKSGKLSHLFSMSECDLVFSEPDTSYDVMGGIISVDEANEKLSKKIEELGYSNTVFCERQFKYTLTSKGKNFSLTFEQGVGTKASDYRYTKGTAPAKADEIAITKVISELIDANIGDTIILDTTEGKKECIITAYFESMNNMGTIIRLHEDFSGDAEHFTGLFPYQVKFSDNPSEKEIHDRAKELEEKLAFEDVMDIKEFSEDTIGVVDTMDAIEMFLLFIMIVVVMFTTILMESSFISNEKGQIAMLKAVGFSEKSIIAWHIKRFGTVSIISVAIAIALSIPATKLTITPIFKMMGAESISYTFDYLKVFALYPLLVLVVTIAFTYITALKTKNIKANDTANIE